MGCQCTSERAMRQPTLFCNSRLIVSPYRALKYPPATISSHKKKNYKLKEIDETFILRI